MSWIAHIKPQIRTGEAKGSRSKGDNEGLKRPVVDECFDRLTCAHECSAPVRSG